MHTPQLDSWLDTLAAFHPLRVLEVGTHRWHDTCTTAKQAIMTRYPQATHTGVDLLPGPDVDIAVDAHELTKHFKPHSFDAILLPYVLEHLRRPWIVAQQLGKITNSGGKLLAVSHMAFPFHPYPSDYWRFTTDALAELFATDTGWRIDSSGYDYPCRVLPLVNIASPWNFEAPAWLNVWCLAVRT